MKVFAGQRLEVQVSQSVHDGDADIQWKRGVAFTAKRECLWDCVRKATEEDVRHTQSRVEAFEARAVLQGQPQTRMGPMPVSFFCGARGPLHDEALGSNASRQKREHSLCMCARAHQCVHARTRI